MNTTLATLTLAALTTVAFAQNNNPQGGTGSVTSQTEFKREIRDPNGNGVAGTEFFKLTYECTWELVRTNETAPKKPVDCILKCNGHKHTKHEECDTSCDTPCPVRTHRFSFNGYTKYDTSAMRAAEKDADNLVLKAGGDPYSANWTSYYTQSLSNAKRMSEQYRQYAVACWNQEPCSDSKRLYGLRKYTFRITGTLTENGYYMTHGVKTPYAPRNRGSHTADVAEVWLPDDDPVSTSVTVRCKCKPAPGGGVVPGGGSGLHEGWVPGIWEGFLIWDDDGFNAEDVVKLLITGVDLNRVHIEVVNNGDKGVTVLIGGGIVFIPSDGGTQEMTVMVQTTVSVPAHSTGAVDARAACIEMNKLEPTGKTTYTVAKDLNHSLAELASITTASRFRGPTDQARVWILTDHATYADMGKHLLPSPSAAQYLNALYDVARASGTDLTGKEFQDCFDPTVLATTVARPEAVDWLVAHVDGAKPDQFKKFAGQGVTALASLLGEKADKDDVQAVAHLAQDLCSCSSSEGRMAGLALLKAVPAAAREQLVADGGLEALLMSFDSGNAKEQEQALEVVDAYNHRGMADEVNKLAALGASDSVKRKAADLAKKLGA